MAVVAEVLLAAIERFLASSNQPAAFEPGEAPFALVAGSYALETRNGRLTLEAWDQSRHLARRVKAVDEDGPGRLVLTIERLGGKTSRLVLADLSRAKNASVVRRGQRDVLLEQMRRYLGRQFAGWRTVGLTTGTDLERTLSPNYPRAFLRKGHGAWAAMAAPPGGENGLLSFALIWFDYLRNRHPELVFEGLALFLPVGLETNTCLRLRYLRIPIRVFLYDETEFEQQIDPRDFGNLDTHLENPQHDLPSTRRPGTPEAQLEALLRASITVVDPTLRPAPVYGQVMSIAGLDRGILDLLAVDRYGRLMVLEVKATEDLHLPIQALDYWMRVAWHARHNNFSTTGYFPGVELRPDPPRLLLIAPALQFHPTTETILRYLDPAIPVERVGLGVEWQEKLKVVFRLEGARRPT